MQYNINYDIAAIILNFMLIVIIYLRRTYSTPCCKMYKWMLWLNLLSATMDALSAYLIMNPYVAPLAVNYLVNILYLLPHNLTAIVFLIYVIVLIRENTGTKAERFFWKSVIAFDVLAITTSPFTGFIFSFDENMVYASNGILMPVLYATAAAILLYALLLFIVHRQLLSTFQITTNISFLLLVMGAVAIQFLHPEILIESFCASIAFLMMNVALDNPAMYFYRNTPCYNQVAFDNLINKKLEAGAKFTLVGFTFNDFPLFKKKFGVTLYDAVISDTIKKCHLFHGQKNVYVLSPNCFVIYLPSVKGVAKIIERLSLEVGKDLDMAEETVSLVPHFCILSHPGLAKTVADVNDAIQSTLDDVYKQTNKRIITCSEKILEKKHREELIVHLLRAAMRSDGFDVYYQPIFDKKENAFTSMEALVRLKAQPENGDYIGPEEFIPIAEKNGLIVELGEIVLESVCKFIRAHKIERYGIKFVEVNLSVLQLLHINYAKRLASICKRNDVPPEFINFEITETEHATENDRKIYDKSIRFLTEQGFSFALDDYGSGYSTATYLAKFPFSIVKIDKGILWNAMNDDAYEIVLEYAIRLISRFKEQCVVEGVENKEMEDKLFSLGCSKFQGYYYSRPLPKKELLKFLAQKANIDDSTEN